MNTQNIDRIILERFKTRLSARTRAELIFFGSRSRGEATEGSDLDVAVILDTPADREGREFVRDCAWEAGFEEGVVVVPFILSRDEWNHGLMRQSGFGRSILREGIPV